VLSGPSQPREARSWEKEACRKANKERYTCSEEGKIRCLEGWIGDLCQVPVCGHDCDPQHGYCVEPGECKCNLGYQGPSCRDCMKLPGCQHGDCTKSFTCHCEPGWGGMFCNVPECDTECGERGQCVAPGECQCEPGLRGENCSECAPPPGCLHGACSAPLQCDCEPGWTGELCDTAVCADTCSKEHGTCSEPGTCRCQLGWSGDTCDTCVAYPGCVNGGCDLPYDCNCAPGWTGLLCDIPEIVESGPGPREGRCQPLEAWRCFNGGTDVCIYDGKGVRIGDPVCRCPPGHWGTWCEQSGNGARTGETKIDPIKPGDLLSIEGVEPRNSNKNNTIISEDLQINAKNLTKEVKDTTEKQIQTGIASLDIRAIHSDVFNSGKLIEHHRGTRKEGLEK